MIFYQILSANSIRKCVEISLEKLIIIIIITVIIIMKYLYSAYTSGEFELGLMSLLIYR